MNAGGNVAGEEIIERFGDHLRVHAFEGYLDSVHLNVESIACRDDAVFHFDHTANFGNRVGYSRRQRAQNRFVIGKKLDLDRLRHAREIADQIFHQL